MLEAKYFSRKGNIRGIKLITIKIHLTKNVDFILNKNDRGEISAF